MAADLILPTAMWVEKEGAYGNAERRTHFWHQLVNAPGEARSDLWQLVEFCKRFTVEEVWPAGAARANPELAAARPSMTCSSPTVRSTRFPLTDLDAGYDNREAKAFGFYLQKGLFEEYASFGRHHGHDLAPFDTYHQVRGLRWPVVNGKETRWRYREGYDPYVEAGSGVQFYGYPDKKARPLRLTLRAAGREPRTRSSISGSSPAACSSTGIPAR